MRLNRWYILISSASSGRFARELWFQKTSRLGWMFELYYAKIRFKLACSGEKIWIAKVNQKKGCHTLNACRLRRVYFLCYIRKVPSSLWTARPLDSLGLTFSLQPYCSTTFSPISYLYTPFTINKNMYKTTVLLNCIPMSRP